MCSTSTPCWSATDATQSLSQFELRKLGVMTENFTRPLLQLSVGQATKVARDKLFDWPAGCFISTFQQPVSTQIQPMNQNLPKASANP